MDRRALIVTYYFPPLGGGGVQRMAKLVKYGTQQGWHFTVVTADERSSIIPNDASLLDEIPPSAKIIRVPLRLLPAGGKENLHFTRHSNYLKRWLSAFFFLPDSRRKWVKKAWPVLQNELKKERYDLVLISLPPYSLSFLAQTIQSRFGVPVLLDLRDPWTLNPYKIHPTPLHRFIDWKLEKAAIGSVRFGVSAYERVLKHYEAVLPAFGRGAWQVIPNGFDDDDFVGLKAPSSGHDSFVVAFSGTIYSHVNHPAPLFGAMALLKRQAPGLGQKLRFAFVGKAHINVQRVARKYGVQKQIIEYGYRPHRESLQILQQAQALMFVLDDREPRSAFTVGGKVYEYLRLKKPILALVPPSGEAADLIRRTDSGKVVAPTRIEEIAATLQKWMITPPKFTFHGIEQYERRRQSAQFVAFFEEILRYKH